MSTITNTLAAKLFGAFVAAAMLLTLVSPAQAQTTEELQQMINDLLAQVAALQSQVGGGSGMSAAGVCPYTWTRSLNVGASGADVMKLQQFLNADPETRIAATGVGSAGMETEYFGGLTGAAVAKFQSKYRNDILSPLGLVNATTYFGPSTMAKANMLCSTAAPADDHDDDGDMGGDVTLGGEASLQTFEISSGDDDELEEGQNDAPVAEIAVEFNDGDAKITRMDVAFVGSGDETDPWDTFENVSLWVDGDKVAEKNADDRDDYLDEDDGSIRFGGLSIVGMEDEEFDVVIGVTTQNSIDGTDDGEDWTVAVDAIRFVDGDDVTTTDDSTGDLGVTSSFSIIEAGGDDELIVKSSSNDPDGTTLQVEDNAKSDWYTVFIFDLDTDDSVNDISLNNVFVSVTVSSSTYTAIVDDAELIIDGTTINSSASDVTGGGTATGVINFDVDGDVEINAGDRVEAELRLRFESLALGDEGTTVTGSVTAANANAIDAEGADDLTNTGTDQLRGAATGDDHTLRTSGIEVSLDGTSAAVTTGDNDDDDYATFEIELEVTAFEQDVFINTNPATSITYSITDGAGTATSSGSRTVTLTSTGDESGGYFEINEGETETITLEVTYDPSVTTSTAARVNLLTVIFDADGGSLDQTWTAVPSTTYRTSVVTIVN
jgi:hypothetical protein